MNESTSLSTEGLTMLKIVKMFITIAITSLIFTGNAQADLG
jgi:hypothetical protein